jgi:hypothetical protein
MLRKAALVAALLACDRGTAPPARAPDRGGSADETRAPDEATLVLEVDSIERLGASVRAQVSTPRERLRVLHDWIVTHIAYDTEATDPPSPEDVDPELVFSRRKGVCAGYARLFVELGRAAGLDVRYRSGDSHAWNEVTLDGVVLAIDTTWDAGYVDEARRFHASYSTKYFLSRRGAAFDHSHVMLARPSPPAEDPCAAPGSCDRTPDVSAFRSACDAGVVAACYEVDWLAAASADGGV